MVECTPVVSSESAAWQRPVTISPTAPGSPDRRRKLDDLSSGTYLLSGAAYTGRRDLALRFVSEAGSASNAGIVVSPSDSAETVQTRLETLLTRAESDDNRGETPPDSADVFANYGIIECESSHRADELQHDGVQYARSPAALTTVGVRLTNQLERLTAEERETVRLSHLSLSTVLMYTNLEAVVKFVSTLRSLLDEFDGTGVLVFNPAMHDDQAVETLSQSVDGVIDVPGGPRA